jgi:hypothetical protein
MDFASFVEGDLPQRLISGLWQIDARMLDVGWRPAGFAGALPPLAGDPGGASPFNALLWPLYVGVTRWFEGEGRLPRCINCLASVKGNHVAGQGPPEVAGAPAGGGEIKL